MKFTAVFQIVAVLGVAPSAMARLRGNGTVQDNADNGRVAISVPSPSEGGGKDEGDGKGKTLIVTLKKDKKNGTANLARECAEAAVVVGGEVIRVYDRVLNGCAVRISSRMTSAKAAGTLAADAHVMVVEEDKKMYTSQSAPYSWGQDRIDQCVLPLDSAIAKVDATGVKVYVIDTGIDRGNVEFSGMIDPNSSCHTDETGEGTPFGDGNGHGTHVAGTICGFNYGVAEGCDLCAIRVLDNSGGGSLAGVIDGLNHAVADCEAAFPDVAGRKCVANMSLGGGYSGVLNTAVQNAVEAGVVVIVAAGNEDTDACNRSPASEPSAITVGSTMINDQFSSFSNYGNCVDLYAPGSGITSAWIGSPTATNTISGTSMASPHVAGIAAGILHDDASADVDARLRADAKLLSNTAQQGYVMRLANTNGGCNSPSSAPTPAPPCTQSVVTVAITTDSYPAETSWELRNECDGGTLVRTGPQYSDPNTLHETEICLPADRYSFVISDTYGDGLCCAYGEGKYEVFMDGELQASGADFGSVKEDLFGSCASVPTPSPVTPTQPPVVAPTQPPVTPTPPPASGPTPSPTSQPTNEPTPSPTEANTSYEPTPSPTGVSTSEATTPGPTFFTCAQFNEANGMACTKAYGGGKCQWLGSCRNCGCVPVRRED